MLITLPEVVVEMIKYAIIIPLEVLAVWVAVVLASPFEAPFTIWLSKKYPFLKQQTSISTLDEIKRLTTLFEKEEKRKGNIKGKTMIIKTLKKKITELENKNNECQP